MVLSAKALGIAPSVTLEVTELAKKMRKEGCDVVGFGAGEPDFDTPQNIVDAAKEALDKGYTRYTPASGIYELKEAVALRLGGKYALKYAPEDIVISNGAKHSLFNVFAALLNNGDEVIIPSPYWVTYPELVRMLDGVPVFIETGLSFKAKAEQIESAITEKTKAILINTPSNPCGSVYTRAELEAIADVAVKADVAVISDEIYDELIYDAKHVSIASLGERIKELTVIVNGLSKTYAMTGWRIGYTASNRKIAKLMGSYQSHAASNPNTIAQYASVEALQGPQHAVEEMRRAFDSRRKLMCGIVKNMDEVSCVTPNGAFYVMLDISAVIGKACGCERITGSVDFARLLLEKTHTAVIPGAVFGTDKHVRLSYAVKEQDITKGLNRIGEFVKSLR